MRRLIFTITLFFTLVGSAFALDEARIEARMIAESAKTYAEIKEKNERRFEEQTEWLAHPEMQEYLDFIAEEKESQARLHKFLETGSWE